MRSLFVSSLILLAACAARQPVPVPVTAPTPAPIDAGVEPFDAGVVAEVIDAGAPTSVDAGPPMPSTAGQPITATKSWSVKLEGLGTSSPRTVDLTGDGVLDVVLGGGVQGQSGWVYAVDGANGKLLWKTRFKEEFYATPTLSDANRDGVPDVFIGGRDFDWTALNGKDGKKLWTLRAANKGADIPKRNFNGALVVGDQDADGIDDLLLSQGGSYDDDKRLPGRLMVVSAATGKLITNVMFPDQKETYSIPALLSVSPLEVIAGSGGETVGGHLSRLALTPEKATATWELDSPKQGVISSPLLTDIGGELSAIDVLYGGIVVRLDAASGAVRWTTPRKGFEARASPAPGRFGGSSTADVVATMSKGEFPVYKWTNLVVWLDGATGQVLDEASSGVFSSASPLVADFDGDGLDETLALSMDSFTIQEGSVTSTLTIYDGARGKKKRLELKLKGAGQATPALADFEGDGKLDLVLTYFGKVERYVLELPGAPAPKVRWGGFRGPRFNGVDPKAE
jgi:outer membrane protein assembly factor BamB